LEPTVALCGNDLVFVDFLPKSHSANPQELAQANQSIRMMMARLSASSLPLISASVAGVSSLALQLSEEAQREKVPQEFFEELNRLALECVGESAPVGKKVVLGVCFDAELAPDLEEIAQRAGLEKQAVIQRFLASRFAAEVVGFMPGFAYLGGLDCSLAFPRRATPRPAVAAGSVAIAGGQAAVYPSATPGGWNLIGRCPDLLFAINREPPVLIALGDEVQFQEITRKEFDRRWAQRSA
jgi:KipI family sensor histidine kinase inhibitor